MKKIYDWADGANLEDHSRRKHKILREYVFDYLTVRCNCPSKSVFDSLLLTPLPAEADIDAERPVRRSSLSRN